MTPQEAQARLSDRGPFLGRFRRRAALRVLVAWHDPAGMCAIAQHVDTAHPEREQLVAALRSLSPQRDDDKIAALWVQWSQAPTPALARVMAQLGWPADRRASAPLVASVIAAPGKIRDPDIATASATFLAKAQIAAPRSDEERASLRKLFSGLRDRLAVAAVSTALERLGPELAPASVHEFWCDWYSDPCAQMAKVLATIGWPPSVPIEWPFARTVLSWAVRGADSQTLRAVCALAAAMPARWPADDESAATVPRDDEVFHAWIRSGDAELEALIARRALRPATPAITALHALATQDIDSYNALDDTGGELMAAAYAIASESFKQRMDVAAQTLAQRAAAERARTMETPPHVLDLCRHNPYSVLGLRPGETTSRMLMRRRDDLVTLLEMHTSTGQLPGYLSTFLGAEANLSIDDVRAAVSRLQNEPDRVKHALLWFKLDDETEEVLAALASGQLAAAESVWQMRCRGDASAKLTFQARFNVALLAHWRLLEERPTTDADSLRNHTDRWSAALAAWRELLAAPQLRTGIESLCARMTDHRIDRAFIDSLRDELALSVLRINVELASAAGARGATPVARMHVQLVQDSGFEPALVARAIDDLLEPLLLPVRTLLHPLTSGTVQLTQDVDYAAMRSDYLRAREPLQAIGQTATLLPVIDGAIDAARSRLDKESGNLAGEARDLRNEFDDILKSCIDEWNAAMDGGDYGRSARLKAIHERLVEEGGGALLAFESAHANLLAGFRRELEGLDLLLLLAKDASISKSVAVRALIQEDTEALESWATAGDRDRLFRNDEIMQRVRGGR